MGASPSFLGSNGGGRMVVMLQKGSYYVLSPRKKDKLNQMRKSEECKLKLILERLRLQEPVSVPLPKSISSSGLNLRNTKTAKLAEVLNEERLRANAKRKSAIVKRMKWDYGPMYSYF